MTVQHLSADIIGEQPTSKRFRSVFIASIGNVLEWFDFTVYGFLAVIMAKNFFPAADELTGLLISFATFGVGFVARPIGAIAFGWFGDIRGRRYVLLLSMLMMAGASLLIGIAPTYQTIGVWAPILIVVARLLQGLSAGGEFGSAAAFLIEWAPEGRRGIYGSLHQVGTAGGLLLGSLLVTILNSILTPEALDSWAWRIPFLFGAVLGLFAIYVRRNVEETPVFRDRDTSDVTDEKVFVPLLKNVGVVILWTVSVFATIVYMPTFTQKFANLTRGEASLATTIALAVTVMALPLAGHLSDKFGRKPILLTAALAFAVLTVPLFHLIVGGASFLQIVFIQSFFAFFSAFAAGPGPATIAELFSTRRRSTLVSIGAAIAVVIFGGFAPFIATLLVDRLGSPIAPAYYVVACAVLTGLTVLTLKETAKAPLK